MSRGHSWKSFKCFKVPRLLHIEWSGGKIKHQVILLHAFTPRYFQLQDKEPEQTVFLSCGVPF